MNTTRSHFREVRSNVSICALFERKGGLQIPNFLLKSIERERQGYENAKREFVTRYCDNKPNIEQLVVMRAEIQKYFKRITTIELDKQSIALPKSKWCAEALAFYFFKENPSATLEDIGLHLCRNLESSLWLDEMNVNDMLDEISVGVGYRILFDELCEYENPTKTRFIVDNAFKLDISKIKEDSWRQFRYAVIHKLLVGATVSNFNQAFTDKTKEQRPIVNKLVWREDLQLLSYFLRQLKKHKLLQQNYLTHIAERAFLDAKGNRITSEQLSKTSAISKISVDKRNVIDNLINILVVNSLR